MNCGVLCFHFLNIKTPSVANRDICESLRRHFDDDKTERAQSSERGKFSLLHLAECWKALLKEKEKAAVQVSSDAHTVLQDSTRQTAEKLQDQNTSSKANAAMTSVSYLLPQGYDALEVATS